MKSWLFNIKQYIIHPLFNTYIIPQIITIILTLTTVTALATMPAMRGLEYIFRLKFKEISLL